MFRRFLRYGFHKLRQAIRGLTMAGNPKPNFRGTNEQRFWRNVSIQENGCWLWTGGKTGGYGSFTLTRLIPHVPGKPVKAHRWLYEQHVALIPDGLEPDHLCRNKACVNPLHLELVTHQENVRRGTGPTAENAAKQFCKRGHVLVEDPRGGERIRMCRICTQMRARLRMRKIRDAAKSLRILNGTYRPPPNRKYYRKPTNYP